MKISTQRKIGGIAFAAVILVLIISILTPALGAKNKSFMTLLNEKDKNIAPVNAFGYGYGYGCCPHTPGYWKNHPDSWPTDSIMIGGITYTKTNAITIMNSPTKGDKTYNMFEHLVAAKLNVLNGCDASCIDEVIEDADEWMEDHPVGSGVKASDPAWDEGEPLKDMLDDYNNGFLCG